MSDNYFEFYVGGVVTGVEEGKGLVNVSARKNSCNVNGLCLDFVICNDCVKFDEIFFYGNKYDFQRNFCHSLSDEELSSFKKNKVGFYLVSLEDAFSLPMRDSNKMFIQECIGKVNSDFFNARNHKVVDFYDKNSRIFYRNFFPGRFFKLAKESGKFHVLNYFKDLGGDVHVPTIYHYFGPEVR